MMMATESSSWPHLPPELLGLILRRLPSIADRVRLRAVCHPWRYNARLLPLPPPLPWLGLCDGTFLSIPGGDIHRLPVPYNACCHGSLDNWIFLVHGDGGCSLMNPFSKATLQLPKLASIWHHEMRNAYPGDRLFFKLVVPSSLELSPDSLVAALIMDSSFHSTISICRIPIATDTIRKKACEPITDVAFFDGKLYALSSVKLFVLEIGVGHKGNPKISSIKCIVDSIDGSGSAFRSFPDYLHSYLNYLVESCGKLLHVRRLVGILIPLPDHNIVEHARTLSFDVFEADLTNDSCHQWRRVNTLGGQALFVGTISKSLPASECGAQEDCIYFMCDYDRRNIAADPFRDCGVFNMRNGMITPLLTETAVVRPQGVVHGHPAWYFPAESM